MNHSLRLLMCSQMVKVTHFRNSVKFGTRNKKSDMMSYACLYGVEMTRSVYEKTLS